MHGEDLRVRRGWLRRLGCRTRGCEGVLIQGKKETGGGRGGVPDDDPRDALHRTIVQVLMYRVELRRIREMRMPGRDARSAPDRSRR